MDDSDFRLEEQAMLRNVGVFGHSTINEEYAPYPNCECYGLIPKENQRYLDEQYNFNHISRKFFTKNALTVEQCSKFPRNRLTYHK